MPKEYFEYYFGATINTDKEGNVLIWKMGMEDEIKRVVKKVSSEANKKIEAELDEIKKLDLRFDFKWRLIQRALEKFKEKKLINAYYYDFEGRFFGYKDLSNNLSESRAFSDFIKKEEVLE